MQIKKTMSINWNDQYEIINVGLMSAGSTHFFYTAYVCQRIFKYIKCFKITFGG